MRSERHGASDDAADLGQRSPEVATVRNRRHMVGAVAGGFALAASGLLLPEAVIAGTEAFDLPVRGEQHQGNKRRRRRHRHSHHGNSPAIRTLAAVALSGSQVIPSNTQTTIRFDVILSLLNGHFDSGTSRFITTISGTYEVELFLTWSGNGVGVCTTILEVNDSHVSNQVLLSPVPRPVRISQSYQLERGDSIQVLGLQVQEPAAAAQMSGGAMVITMFSFD